MTKLHIRWRKHKNLQNYYFSSIVCLSDRCRLRNCHRYTIQLGHYTISRKDQYYCSLMSRFYIFLKLRRVMAVFPQSLMESLVSLWWFLTFLWQRFSLCILRSKPYNEAIVEMSIHWYSGWRLFVSLASFGCFTSFPFFFFGVDSRFCFCIFL